jgi:hypothetical protein
MRDHPLAMALSCAVPLLVMQARAMPDGVREERLAAWRTEALPVICERGDILLYRSKKKGETAAAFNTAAKGIAALSFHPGGFRAFGLHWCAVHSPGGAIPSAYGCPGCTDQ